MALTDDRIKALRAMANQTSSPHEATIARGILKKNGISLSAPKAPKTGELSWPMETLLELGDKLAEIVSDSWPNSEMTFWILRANQVLDGSAYTEKMSRGEKATVFLRAIWKLEQISAQREVERARVREEWVRKIKSTSFVLAVICAIGAVIYALS